MLLLAKKPALTFCNIGARLADRARTAAASAGLGT